MQCGSVATTLVLFFFIIIIIVHRVQYEQTTQCIENSVVRESYSETVQSAEIISLISDSRRKLWVR